jgi:pimeloyl-[acyl-carrier protein] methyl ester esterase
MRRVFRNGWGSRAWPEEEVQPGDEVVGWSLGALRALDLAGEIELGGLVLVAATPQFVRAGDWRHGWPARVLARMRERLAVEPDALLDEFQASMFAPDEAPVVVERETDVSVLDDGLTTLERVSVLDSLDRIVCPVRLLHGGGDGIVPLAAAEALAAALPHADLTVWDEAGHAPHLTQAARFAAWLDRR